MEIKCNECKAPLLKSYGATIKLRSKSIRWDALGDTAVVQCNMCRSFNDVPLTLKVEQGNMVLEVGTEIRKSTSKQQLIVPSDKKIAKNSDKQQ